MTLVALLASALNFNQTESKTVTDLNAQVAQRDKVIADLHTQLDGVGAPLTDDQKAQLLQVIQAAQAATPHPDAPAPATVNVAAAGDGPVVVGTDGTSVVPFNGDTAPPPTPPVDPGSTGVGGTSAGDTAAGAGSGAEGGAT